MTILAPVRRRSFLLSFALLSFGVLGAGLLLAGCAGNGELTSNSRYEGSYTGTYVVEGGESGVASAEISGLGGAIVPFTAIGSSAATGEFRGFVENDGYTSGTVKLSVAEFYATGTTSRQSSTGRVTMTLQETDTATPQALTVTLLPGGIVPPR